VVALGTCKTVAQFLLLRYLHRTVVSEDVGIQEDLWCWASYSGLRRTLLIFVAELSLCLASFVSLGDLVQLYSGG